MSHNKSICWSKKVVWAPGTPCGNEKICLDGECVPAGHGAIDGGWSQWSEWTNCTVDCGGGVRWRRRFCDNPRPRRGGSFCRGQRAMAETCSQASCSQQSTGGSAEAPRVLVLGAGVTARDAQCAQFAVKQARSVEIAAEVGDAREQRLTAVALHHRLSSDSLCRSVTCSMQPADRSGNSVRSSRLARIFTVDRVRDGSPCHPFDYGVCIGGVCQPAGCDGVLNSNSRWDACGVCGGSNETCHLQSRSFEIDIKPGTSYLHTFSQGSSSIELMTEGGGGRFCTVELIKSSKDSSDKGKFLDSLYPNGNHMKTNLAETVNQKKPESNNFIEITSSKELADRFDEEYMASGAWILISKKQNDWRIRGIGRLSSNFPAICTKVEHICEDISGMKLSAVRRLPMAVCRSVHPPIPIPPLPPSLMCNTHCRLEWRRVAGNCSARCGNGTAVDSFDCVLSKSDGTPDVVLDEPIKDVKYKDAYCDNRSPGVLGLGRRARKPADLVVHEVAWQFVKNYKCLVEGGGLDSECKDEPIPGKLIEACENTTVECPKWKISEWSSCDAYCSSGIKQRSVYCRWKSEPVPSELCPGQMPETVRNCTGWCFGRWVAGNWSKCHMPCQNGHRFREVNCMIGTR
uniref:ADAM_CR_2 domain-containing protein n=1 Tax=Macrostomum lignano TaxID=282301 RepID=A0A1I8HAK7_9PLAT